MRLLLLLVLPAALIAFAQPSIRLEAEDGEFLTLPEDALGYVPAGDGAAPLIVVLHGAGGNAASATAPVSLEASRRGIALVAVKSGGATWDAFEALSGNPSSGFSGGAVRLPSGDRKRIERAVAVLSDRARIDPDRIALLGFSDGATMALSLGAARPRDYPTVIAFAPGGYIPGRRGSDAKQQRILIAHGTSDRIIPFDHDRRYVCPKVERDGRSVHFLTFDGGHEVARGPLVQALERFLEPAAPFGEAGCPH